MRQLTALHIPYGCDEFGRLTHVLLHRPGRELDLLDSGNHRAWLFDEVPDVPAFIDEHDRFRHLLLRHGVEVIELLDHARGCEDLARRLPNLTYLHDSAVISSRGAIVSRMASGARGQEEVIVREALCKLGIPVLIDFDEDADAFEGCLLLTPETVVVVETERHSPYSIAKFVKKALVHFREVVHIRVPPHRRYMHPDTVLNRLRPDLLLAYLPAFKTTFLHTVASSHQVNFSDLMRQRGIEVFCVSDAEQRRLACSFVPLEPGVLFHYDTSLEAQTVRRLAKKGIDFLFFHPNALLAGGGSLRCLTLRVRRNGTAAPA